MSDERQVYEQVVKPPKRCPKLVRKRILFVAAYILFFVAWLPAALYFPEAIITVALLDVLLTAALVMFTIHRLKPEFEYELLGERLTVSEIFGGRARKKRLTLDVRKITAVYSMEDGKNVSVEVEKVYNAAFGRGEGCFIALFDDDGDASALFFEPSDELLKKMVKFNRRISFNP